MKKQEIVLHKTKKFSNKNFEGKGSEQFLIILSLNLFLINFKTDSINKYF